MDSMKGTLKLRPGVRMRRYLPKTVITTIVPCLTDTKDEKSITKKIKTTINEVISGVMVNSFVSIKVIVFILVCYLFLNKLLKNKIA
jgi:hypothetical protein